MINNLPYNNTIRDYYLTSNNLNKNNSSFSDFEDYSSHGFEELSFKPIINEICSLIRTLNEGKEEDYPLLEWEKRSIKDNERLLGIMSKYGG